MTWGAVAVAGASVVMSYRSQQEAKAEAEAARKEGRAARLSAEQLQAEQLAFEQERYDNWQEMYGDTEKNIAEFYGSLTSADVAASSLQQIQKSYTQAREQQQQRYAQQGITGGAQKELEQQMDISEAEAKAGARADAPYQLAQMQQSVVSGSSSMANPYGDNLGQARAGMANTYMQGAQYQGQLEAQANATRQQAMSTMAQGIGTAAKIYTYNQGLNNQQQNPNEARRKQQLANYDEYGNYIG